MILLNLAYVNFYLCEQFFTATEREILAMLTTLQASVDSLYVSVASQGPKLASIKSKMRLLTPGAISEQQGLLDDVSLLYRPWRSLQH